MKRNVMRSIFLGLLLALLLSAGASGNGTERPEPVRAVVLYTEDADPGAVEFYLVRDYQKAPGITAKNKMEVLTKALYG